MHVETRAINKLSPSLFFFKRRHCNPPPDLMPGPRNAIGFDGSAVKRGRTTRAWSHRPPSKLRPVS